MAVLSAAEALKHAFFNYPAADFKTLATVLSEAPNTVEIDREAFVKAQARSLPEEFKQAVFQEILNRMIQEKLEQGDVDGAIEIIRKRITYLKTDTLEAIAAHSDAFSEVQDLIREKTPLPNKMNT